MAPIQDITMAATPDQFRYYYQQPPTADERMQRLGTTVLGNTLSDSCLRYGIETEPLGWGEVPTEDERQAHVVIGPYNPLQYDPTFRPYIARLVERGARVSLAPAFPLTKDLDSKEYQALVATGHFEAEDAFNGTHTLRPEASIEGFRTVAPEDILEDLVDKTFRIKFSAELVDDDVAWGMLSTLQVGVSTEVNTISSHFRNKRLWDQDSTEGAVLLRDWHTPWLVSALDSDKNDLGIDDFVLIHGFDPTNRTIQYTGIRPPSLHTPELLAATKKLPLVNIAMHFHHEAIRGVAQVQDQRWLGTSVLETGTFDAGETIAVQVEKRLQKGLIDPDHGIYCFGENPNRINDILLKLDMRDKVGPVDATTDH